MQSKIAVLAVVLVALTWTLLFPATLVSAAAGDLDTTFGNGGKVTTDFGSQFDFATTVVIQTDGKIVAGGSNANNPKFDDTAFAVARYNIDGSLDGSFGTGGKVITNVTPISEQIAAMTLEPGGKIVAAGSTVQGLGLVRYDTNGNLDPTFGSGGKVIGPIHAGNNGLCIAAQSDGKLLVANTIGSPSGGSAFLLVRYNTDGSLDSGFGSGGQVITSFETDSSDFAESLAIQSDGRIVLAGSTTNSARTLHSFALARYESNGSLDLSFGNGGKVTTPIAGYFNDVLALAVEPDGHIQAVGTSHNIVATFAANLRYNSNGSLDAAFGTGGHLPGDSLNRDDIFLERMVIAPDGHLVAVGNTRVFPSDVIVVRYNANGNFDPGFGLGGKTTIDFTAGNESGQGLALQVDGKIVVAGGASGDFALARLQGGPNFDTCVQDDSNGNLLMLNTTTGDYQFTNCGSVTVSGIGAVSRRGGLITLQHNAADRRVLARLDIPSGKGTATVQLLPPSLTFNILDRNIANNTCVCR